MGSRLMRIRLMVATPLVPWLAVHSLSEIMQQLDKIRHIPTMNRTALDGPSADLMLMHGQLTAAAANRLISGSLARESRGRGGDAAQGSRGVHSRQASTGAEARIAAISTIARWRATSQQRP